MGHAAKNYIKKTHLTRDLTYTTELTNKTSNYTGRINSGNVYYFNLFIYLLAVYVTPPSPVADML